MRATTAGLVAGAAAALLVAGCGGGDDGSGAGGDCLDGTSGEVTIVAKDIAWDADCIEATADEPLVISVDNRDSGVNHNLHLKDAPGNPKTGLEPGPVVQRLTVTLPAGSYEYVCDIHPNMVGTLEAAAAT
ncbi:MAG TPA: cupredoxin domain-containing protein [Acidimicrobiales bacterium]|jgi:plastocyanin|nr:cupredoxin domain-containing protein [Acidimicrobiales bacterium]